MMTFIIIVHVIACVVLIVLVLIQRGRGAGLVESFAGVESMFGTKTSAFLTRTTTIMSVVFFLTCLSLAVLSVKQSKSLMRNTKVPAKAAAAKTEAVKTGAMKVEPAKAEAPKAAKTEAVKAPEPVGKIKPEAGKAE
ncbi:MAG: preprotein translocase subunit SecG [Candidatus Omnitrophica bacterium]|jgi:preprotein translocase subunit SecG|nr:preprotein translocase subunit SecG [Candidatus Omnitrophota bacterium]MDD5691383.1 preprotein translocase subunit SecG [Candidatus Omnitrophota bacterium]